VGEGHIKNPNIEYLPWQPMTMVLLLQW